MIIIRPTVYDRPTVLPFDRPIDRPTDRPTFTRVVAVADILTDANRYGRFLKDIIIRTEMNNRERVLAIAYISTIAYAATAITQIVNSKKQRRAWIRDILRRRREEGTHSVLIPQLVSDGFHYRNFLRMDKESFVFLME